MGYESKIYIVHEYPKYGEGMPYGQVIAMFDLCKMAYSKYCGMYFPDLFNEERTCDFYADDGNTVIVDDNYGDAVRKAESNKDVIKWLKACTKENDWYLPKVFLDTLLSLEKSKVKYSLYHYGY